jgi:hypothetical protein
MGSAAGGFPVAQLTSGHVRATGIGLPTRGRGYPGGRPTASDVNFS